MPKQTTKLKAHGYVRTKKNARGHVYHYLVSSKRERGKVRQTIIAYLGRHATVAAALEAMQREIQEAETSYVLEVQHIQDHAELEGRWAARGAPMYRAIWRYQWAKRMAPVYRRRAAETRERMVSLKTKVGVM